MATIQGSAGHDTLIGTSGDDLLEGLNGNDQLEGRAGNDRLEGGAGDDSLLGGIGNNTLLGGEGNDWITTRAGANDSVDGGGGYDRLIFNLSDRTEGFHFVGVGTFDPNAVVTQINPVKGSATYTGIEVVDIYGGTGDDTIEGGAAPNFITGHGGNNLLTGGGGQDVFGFNLDFPDLGTDRITDLSAGEHIQIFRINSTPFALSPPLLSGDNPSGLTQGQVMVGSVTGGITKVYVGTNDAVGGDLVIELARQ